MGRYSGPGLTITLKQVITNEITLQAGEVVGGGLSAAGLGGYPNPFPAGDFYVLPGKYTVLQQKDPVTGIWRGIGGGPVDGSVRKILSDGNNYRLANQTGCAVGALLTNAGSGYTSAPAVAASAGSSIWQAIVGGAVSTTVTVTNGGANYTYPPQVIFAPPPYGGGIHATGYATLTNGAVSSVTVTNQGAGYPTAPAITFANDWRENNPSASTVTAGYNAAATSTLTGANTITGLLCLDHGTPLTAVPTLTFTGGGGSSAAATAIMCWSITAFAPTAGTGFGTSLLSGLDAFPTAAAAYTNPATQSGLVATRQAQIKMLASAGAPTATGAVFYDGGIYTSTPTPLVITNGALITQTATFTFTMGGVTDTSYLTPM
jgi:hypothetical protein